MKAIERNKAELHSERVLTMNVLYKEACSLEKILVHEVNLPGNKCEEYRVQV